MSADFQERFILKKSIDNRSLIFQLLKKINTHFSNPNINMNIVFRFKTKYLSLFRQLKVLKDCLRIQKAGRLLEATKSR